MSDDDSNLFSTFLNESNASDIEKIMYQKKQKYKDMARSLADECNKKNLDMENYFHKRLESFQKKTICQKCKEFKDKSAETSIKYLQALKEISRLKKKNYELQFKNDYYTKKYL
ncbi:hypothetical protein CWI38_1147p0020 [Hamiltosporidium tvaerminnensis]|uniref:Uncharacterized protein n=2 Tax=Hamiltosporidium TaxID=1176354 RepID=A0A4Q9LIZ3_9MICR|nr:hypothetical protein CWI37_0718p0020 [Hamiltosporidium tvaerminnensis]TBU07000.1 hypothetical protein CWI36_0345p0030 [Hamiltosporidium magnivora]TBU07590.1 hypothetical protein CWI39_0298p0020 [Hamiltosporidium magnivora]TBU11548.1 hypothetical protein CWI38_1147p0020 [Hamiltosporidium tvaerminnensis]